MSKPYERKPGMVAYHPYQLEYKTAFLLTYEEYVQVSVILSQASIVEMDKKYGENSPASIKHESGAVPDDGWSRFVSIKSLDEMVTKMVLLGEGDD